MSDSLSVMKNDVKVSCDKVAKLEKELNAARAELYKRQKRLSDNCPHTKTTPLISTGYDSCDDCGELL
ncbi:hypothetical protein M3_0106 [Lysinibacillus phage vB_LfM_LysYB1]|nr:hypothetical protein M3_0106 [Lysinibacillus phage vB_LfM_LysYB1]WAB25385.1 hypothetical protein M5_0207 [Lysinibacillus phage vB_LfM_LysYB2]